MKVRLRACERCGGDLVPDRWDRYGQTLTCLQCGFDVTLSRLSRGAETLLRSVAPEGRAETSGTPVAIGGRRW
jgi:hypothetical protein